MSDGPDFELQAAIVPWLEADANVTRVLTGGIHDQPPANVKYPYFTVGEAQVIRDDAVGVDGQQVHLTMHAWSIETGFPQVKRAAAVVVESLHLASLTLASFRLVSLMHRQTRTFRDADGLTSHAVIEFVANTEKLIA